MKFIRYVHFFSNAQHNGLSNSLKNWRIGFASGFFRYLFAVFAVAKFIYTAIAIYYQAIRDISTENRILTLR